MDPISIIKKKQSNNPLSKDEIAYFINSYIKGDIPDYQMAAFLMAVFFVGMDFNEIYHLTDIFVRSGKVLNFPKKINPKIDKHSTGGVGDKVSLLLAPLVSSCGIYIPMLSGRGLGHTGGTLDKIESIYGYKVNLSMDEMVDVIQRCGYFISGATEEIVPADKKIYELRDVTSTVSSLPLIVSSILSKKIAEGIDGLVMDVKCGTGSFIKSLEDAEKLSDYLIEVSKKFKIKTVCVISNMNFPLGKYIGNSLEVIEAIDILKGNLKNDVYHLTMTLGAYMLLLGGIETDLQKAKEMLKEAICSGRAYETFLKNVKEQGGDERLNLRVASDFVVVKAKSSGFLKYKDVSLLGKALQFLGGGRFRKGEKIDHSVGIEILRKSTEEINSGDDLFKVFYSSKSDVKEALKLIDSSFEIVPHFSAEENLIIKVMGV